ncbi:hypothetical protein HOY80DRAFT_879288 [Tuber brumale]|nr:hypothetical protein HOY80DRAFT_879288 [Tuber brumale]
MADTLRLAPESLSMAYVYLHRYNRWASEESCSPLDDHTLCLASLSLSTKATESPRRLRELLVPAYAHLHPSSPPLTFPSPLYDSLRSTIVAAELLLLRVLRFDLRVPLPYDFLPRFLEKVLPPVATPAEEECAETKIVDICETALGREVWSVVGRVMTSYKICNFFPARSVAAACLFHVALKRGLRIGDGSVKEWVKRLTGGKVEHEDFVEALEEIDNLCGAGSQVQHQAGRETLRVG